jgi:hypothetical protein
MKMSAWLLSLGLPSCHENVRTRPFSGGMITEALLAVYPDVEFGVLAALRTG